MLAIAGRLARNGDPRVLVRTGSSGVIDHE